MPNRYVIDKWQRTHTHTHTRALTVCWSFFKFRRFNLTSFIILAIFIKDTWFFYGIFKSFKFHALSREIINDWISSWRWQQFCVERFLKNSIKFVTSNYHLFTSFVYLILMIRMLNSEFSETKFALIEMFQNKICHLSNRVQNNCRLYFGIFMSNLVI